MTFRTAISILFSYCLLGSSLGCHKTWIYTTEKVIPSGQPTVIIIDGIESQIKHLSLVINDDVIPIQRIKGDRWCLVAAVDIPADIKCEIKEAPSQLETVCSISSSRDFIHVTIEDREILRYAISTQYPADSLPLYYKRSGFIHPVATRSGHVISDDFPEGHVHQHGMFHAWTRTFIRDSLVDFWNQHSQLGDIRHREVMAITNGPVFSSFSVGLDYLAYLMGDTIVVSNEIWNIRVYPLQQHYLLDWEIDHIWLGPDTLLIDEYHYGGTAFRGSEQWNMESGAYDSLVFLETNLHKSHIKANHSRPEWVTMYGLTGPGQYAGLAFIPSRDNFRYPQPIRVHPTMPYFCFAPMVLGQFRMHPDDLYQSKCRILVFDGKPDYSLIERTLDIYHD